LISWGITVSARAQRLSGYACAGIGAVLLALALNSLLGFTGRGIAPFQKVHTAVAAAPQAPSH
ncbi:MAG TPA: hypothetical protein VEI97_07130, partial [bacterium]|nr:hypothetical protein [bacterium]